jgi:putative membrane protein
MKLILGWLALGIAVAVTVLVVPGIDVDYSPGVYWAIAAVFGIVNVTLGTILRFVALPLTVLTLGLFGLVINAAMFLVTDWLMDSLQVDGFLPALFGSVVIALALVAVEGVAMTVGRELRRPG